MDEATPLRRAPVAHSHRRSLLSCGVHFGMTDIQIGGLAQRGGLGDVLDGFAVHLDRHPAALGALRARGEVPELAVVLRALQMLREPAGNGGRLDRKSTRLN